VKWRRGEVEKGKDLEDEFLVFVKGMFFGPIFVCKNYQNRDSTATHY